MFGQFDSEDKDSVRPTIGTARIRYRRAASRVWAAAAGVEAAHVRDLDHCAGHEGRTPTPQQCGQIAEGDNEGGGQCPTTV